MVATDDEVGGAVILSDQRMPESFARSRHAHSQRQHREKGRAPEVSNHRLVAAHSADRVDVPRLSPSHRGVEKDRRIHRFRGSADEFDVRAMERIAGLEGHHARPAELGEPRRELGGSVTVGAEQGVRNRFQDLDRTSETDRLLDCDDADQLADPGMRGIGGTQDRLGLRPSIGAEDAVDREDCQRDAFRMQESHAVAQGDALGEGVTHPERDRDRP